MLYEPLLNAIILNLAALMNLGIFLSLGKEIQPGESVCGHVVYVQYYEHYK